MTTSVVGSRRAKQSGNHTSIPYSIPVSQGMHLWPLITGKLVIRLIESDKHRMYVARWIYSRPTRVQISIINPSLQRSLPVVIPQIHFVWAVCMLEAS